MKKQQFGKKQFWVFKCNRFDVWVSYNTAVAIVDNRNKWVYLGCCARGFSRTTTRQVSQALYTFAPHYMVFSCESDFRKLFDECHPELTNAWGDKWDEYNHATRTIYTVDELEF